MKLLFVSWRRIAMMLTFACLVSLTLSSVELRSVGLFFLDWKQILAVGSPPDVGITILDLSNLKENGGHNQEKISSDDLKIIIEQISQVRPKFILVTFSATELKVADVPQFAKDLSTVPNLYFLGNNTVIRADHLMTMPRFKPGPEYLWLLLTHDTEIDSVSRRILTSYDLEKKNLNDDFEDIRSLWGHVNDPKSFSADFIYKGARQVFMRIWPWHDYGRTPISSARIEPAVLQKLTNRLVILDTSDMYSLNGTPNILGRVPGISSSDLGYNLMPAGTLVATYLTNFLVNVYVKTPSATSNFIWTFLGLVVLLGSLVFAPVKKSFWMSSLVLIIYSFLGLLVFYFGSWNFDTGKVLLSGLAMQYLILPYRYLKRIRQLDAEAFAEKALVIQQKLNNRILVKAAVTDSTLRTAGKVAHDIRSPLTALNFANSLLKKQNTQELRDLISAAVRRIEDISNDLSRAYSEKTLPSLTAVNLLVAIKELTATYQFVDSKIVFIYNIPEDIFAHWPLLSLQRSVSNLINNSIEACAAVNQDPVIKISAKIDEDRIKILFADNGPGVANENIAKIFNEGATFGKVGGKGLGLIQVRHDLASIGGLIRYIPADGGATFEISLPTDMSKLALKISRTVLVVESRQSSSLVTNLPTKDFQVFRFSDFKSAEPFVKGQDLKSLTLILDLTLEGSDETAFDFLDNFTSSSFYKIILCSSIEEDSRISSLANSRGAVLVSRASLNNYSFHF